MVLLHLSGLRDLVDEVGSDVARFHMLTRKSDAALDFDFDKVVEQSKENPVFYVQYAHARICAVFRQADEQGLAWQRDEADLSQLTSEHEQRLITTLSRYPEVVAAAAEESAVQAIPHYLRDLADAFHSYYNAQKFLDGDTGLRNARLTLVAATRQVLANGLVDLLGISAPERM